MSFNTTVTSTNSVVSGLENVLMQSVEQGVQAGQSTNSGTLQEEMQLLTALLNQPEATSSDPSQQTGSQPQTGSSSQPAVSTPKPDQNSSSSKLDRKLDSSLEQDMTSRFQNGQQPTNNNVLEQEMNLLIRLLGQSA